MLASTSASPTVVSSSMFSSSLSSSLFQIPLKWRPGASCRPFCTKGSSRSVSQIHDVSDWAPNFLVFVHLFFELLDVVHQVGHQSNQHQRWQSPPRCWSPWHRACPRSKRRVCHPCCAFTSLKISCHHHRGDTHDLFHLCSTNNVLLIGSFAHQSNLLHEVFSAISGSSFCIQISRILFCRNALHQKPFLSHCLLTPKDSCWKMFC